MNEFSFGSKEWNEYYHGRNNSGHRARKHMKPIGKREWAAWDQFRCDEMEDLANERKAIQWEASLPSEDLSVYDCWPVINGYSLSR